MVILTRRKEFLKQDLAFAIFPDYSYRFDEEKIRLKDGQAAEKRIFEKADYILSCDPQLLGERIISYDWEKALDNDKGWHEEMEVLLDMQHRLSARYIYMAAAIIDRLKRDNKL